MFGRLFCLFALRVVVALGYCHVRPSTHVLDRERMDAEILEQVGELLAESVKPSENSENGPSMQEIVRQRRNNQHILLIEH